VEEEEHEDGYAIGENCDGGLRAREASRSLGGCLGQRETTDIAGNGGRRRDGRDQQHVLISTEQLVLYL